MKVENIAILDTHLQEHKGQVLDVLVIVLHTTTDGLEEGRASEK